MVEGKYVVMKVSKTRNSPICILLFRDIFIEIPLLQFGTVPSSTVPDCYLTLYIWQVIIIIIQQEVHQSALQAYP